MTHRNALVPVPRRSRHRDIAVRDLMPPEGRYRPSRTADSALVGTFFFVFAMVFAMLWLSASLVPVLVIITVYFARGFALRAAHASAVQQNQAAVNLLNAGRIEEAARIFDQLTRTERNTPAHAVYVFNRAVAYMLQGRPRRAYSLFNAVLRSHAFHFGFSQTYLPLLHVEIGTCLALFGELEEARRHRDEAAKLLPNHELGRVVFLDVLMLTRQGHHRAAAELATQRWREAEALLRTPTLKALRLCHAFALAREEGHRGRAFDALVQGVRPSETGDFDWLGAEWPEFRGFLHTLGL